jgi:hypothetical protein
MRRLFSLAATLALVASTARAQPATAYEAETASVERTVTGFLLRLGDHEVDTLAADFAPHAIIVVSREQGGEWTTVVQTADDWIAGLKRTPKPAIFREPLTNIRTTIEEGRHLAHLRAEFQVMRDGRPVSSGVDQFTLVLEASGWKIAAVAYTSRPVR